MDHVNAIRDAADALTAATLAARAAGYRVDLQLSTLDRIEVSETGAVKPPEPAPEPAPAKPAKG
jgi:hypothetical protein